MTEAEAQELIAEIKEKTFGVMPENYTGLDFKDVEKIITRFANKPPYVLVTDDNQMYLDMRAHPSQAHKDKTLIRIQRVNKDIDLVDCGIGLTISELKQLRDNCNKMLERLENDRT